MLKGFLPRFGRLKSFFDLICINYQHSKANGVAYVVLFSRKPKARVLYWLLLSNDYCQSFELSFPLYSKALNKTTGPCNLKSQLIKLLLIHLVLFQKDPNF